MRLCLTAIVLLNLIAAETVQAEEALHNFSYYQQTSDGRTSVCGIEHSFIFKDDVNDNDAATMHLVISFFGDAKKILAFFKFQEGTFRNSLKQPPVNNPIGNASVFFGGQSHPLQRSECQDDKLSFCGGLGGDEAANLEVALTTQNVQLLFNRKPGQLDYSFDISERPNGLVSPEKFYSEAKDHAKCIVSVFSPK